MKKILLANIGNRNLKYRGETYYHKTHGSTFKEWTLSLLNNFDSLVDDLSINILNDLLEVQKEHLGEVILFTSNQIDEQKQDQDTIYEGQILKQLIEREYGLAVRLIEVNCKVTDNDLLLRFYRYQLYELKNQHGSDLEVVICDAGGTAQQKSALKITAEFMLDVDCFEVWYVNPDSHLEAVQQQEYRRIIDEIQVSSLVQNGQFEGALSLYSQLPTELQNPDVSALLQVAAKRIRFFWNDAQLSVSKSWKTDQRFALVYDFKTEAIFQNYENDFKEDFPNKNKLFQIAERFEMADFFFQIGDWSLAVLNYAIFMESFLNQFITNRTNFDLVGSYEKGSNEMVQEIKNYYDGIIAFFGGRVQKGVPLSIKYAQTLADKDSPTYELLQIFEGLNEVTNKTQKGLQVLRNSLVHNGKSVTKKDMNNHLPFFEQNINDTRRLLGLAQKNSFVDMQYWLTQLLKN